MRKKILIIDDDPDVVLFISTVLEDHGYRTVSAPDGREGLEKARTERPHLILLDLMMPRKSGISLLSDLKQDDTLKLIPVIMITGVSGETGIDLESFFQPAPEGRTADTLRPVGYMEKPVSPETLLMHVKRTLEREP